MEIENRRLDRIVREISRWEIAEDDVGEDDRENGADVELNSTGAADGTRDE